MPYVPLATQSIDAPYSGERALNYIPALLGNRVILKGRGGLVPYGVAGVNPPTSIDAMAVSEDQPVQYVVSNGALYSITTDAYTELVTIPGADTATKIDLAVSFNAVALAVDGTYHFWDGTTLTQPAVGALTRVEGVVYHAGYFIPYGDAQGRCDAFQPSGLDQGGTFDASHVQYAEGAGDCVTRCISSRGLLWVIGTASIEAYATTGTNNPVFARQRSITIPIGTRVGATVAKDETGFYFFGSDGRVYRVQGATPERIGTPEKEKQLAKFPPSRGFTFFDNGHSFYALVRDGGTTETRATTLSFDRDLRRWSERSTGIYGEENEPQFVVGFRGFGEDPWGAHMAARNNGVQWFGGPFGLATIDPDTFTDFGDDVIYREAISSPIRDGSARVTIKRVSLLMNPGYAPADAQVRLYAAKRNRVWGSPRTGSLGELGEYDRQIRFNKFGVGRDWQFKVVVTDAVNADIYGIEYQ